MTRQQCIDICSNFEAINAQLKDMEHFSEMEEEINMTKIEVQAKTYKHEQIRC